MPIFRIENELGQWLTDMALSQPSWKAGDSIYRGRDTLRVVEVRYSEDETTLVIEGHDVLGD